jgi:hypothetical protein
MLRYLTSSLKKKSVILLLGYSCFTSLAFSMESSSEARWSQNQHQAMQKCEEGVVLPTLIGMMQRAYSSGELSKQDLYSYAVNFVGSQRRGLACATKDASYKDFGILRTKDVFPYTPIGAYPLMMNILKPFLLGIGDQLECDGKWHEYDIDQDYKIQYGSLASWYEFINVLSNDESLNKEEREIDAFLHLQRINMILYGDKGSINGPAGIVFIPLPTKKDYKASDRLVKLFINDSIEYEKTQRDLHSINIGCLETRFKNTTIGTRKIFWITDATGETDETAITLFHPLGNDFLKNHLLTKSLFNQALTYKESDIESKKLAIARFSYMFSLTMPFSRGSALCNEWLTIALSHLLELPEQNRKDLKKMDEFAQTSLSFKDYLRKIFPEIKATNVSGIMETKEHAPIRIESNDPIWNAYMHDFKLQVFPFISTNTELCRLMYFSGSDKNSIRHTYTQLYDFLFGKIKDQMTNVLEIGIGSTNPKYAFTMGPTGTVGASLRAYRDYFPNAQIYGADIDEEALFEEDRIKCFFIDGLNPEVIKQAFEKIAISFDLIFDDGFHNFTANSNCALEGLQYLSKDGYYVIEDVKTDEIHLFRNFLNNELNQFTSAIFKIPAFDNADDNNVIVIRHKDAALNGIFERKKTMPVQSLSSNAIWQNALNNLSIELLPPISEKTLLDRLMKKAGSDKNGVRHTYPQLYDFVLNRMREEATHVLEIGIGSTNHQFAYTMWDGYSVGASLRAYRDYFPNAQIYGADIDKDAFFTEDRIQCLFMDASNPKIIDQSFKQTGVLFDVIFDDGLHEFFANRNCLLKGINYLKPNGTYIIEDVKTAQIPTFKLMLETLQEFGYDWAIVALPALENIYDNNVIIVRKKNALPLFN